MTNRRKTPPLSITLSSAPGALPLKDQIYAALFEKIKTGELRPGDRLPSSRVLAELLGCGRVTVTSAFSRLTAEGFLVAGAGRGTIVAKPVSNRASVWTAETLHGAEKPLAERAATALAARSFRVQTLRPFAVVSPDFESLPGKKWTQIVARVSKSPWLHNGYCEPGGHAPFREAIADYVRRARGINCAAEDVIVTSGIQQGVTMCAQILFNPGDLVITEDPGYRPHREAFAFNGLRTSPVAVGTAENPGWNTKEAAFAEARGMLVTPCHQYPLGYLMPLEKRRELLCWAASRRTWLLEDDYDGELRYDGEPYPALASLDKDRGSVVNLGSFTKMIYPGFNLGYLIAPKGLAKYFEGAKLLNDRHASEVHQVIMSEFIAGGFYEAHIRRLKKLYESRRSTMLAEIDRHLAPYGRLIPCRQGTHLTFLFTDPADDRRLADYLRRLHGLEVRPLSACYAAAAPLSGLILGFAGFTEDQIRLNVKELAKGIGQFLQMP